MGEGHSARRHQGRITKDDEERRDVSEPMNRQDKFKRIAVVALDIGIIALMLVSLVWNAPAFKMQEDPEAALTKTFDDRWAE
jgi:hypothetical protein